MTTCPNCGQKAMSGLTKAFLGPGRTVACTSCGSRLSTPWRALALNIPLIVGALLALSVLGDAGLLVLFPVAAAANFLTYRYVPLVVRGPAKQLGANQG